MFLHLYNKIKANLDAKHNSQDNIQSMDQFLLVFQMHKII